MFNKIVFACVTLIMTMGFALAQVEVNQADQAALDGLKGIGPSTSKAIMEERKKGAFKDWQDFAKRVKGIGEAQSSALSKAGLTVNGSSKPAPVSPR
jgi:competence protein ComEA